MKDKYFLIISVLGAIGAFIWSVLSLGKLGNIGDSDPILTPLRIINRDIVFLSISILSLIGYLWRKK